LVDASVYDESNARISFDILYAVEELDAVGGVSLSVYKTFSVGMQQSTLLTVK
jgi:hypothetical protein